jgi:glycine/D-amino acid oxidase-like deaminating enzyme
MTAPRVAVAGGGIAGLTAALRLAQRGYRVKLVEQKSMLGGNLGSRQSTDGVRYDVYPHMYLNWYHNFWRLLGDVTSVDRRELFAPFGSVKQLREGAFPRFTALTDTYSPWHMLQNLFSGVGPPADMFLFAYANIDLLAERLNPTALLDDLSVNGFLHARPYMTERAAAAYNSWITRVWAIPSYLASADDYRTYLEHSCTEREPAFWLLRGAAADLVIDPLAAALEAAGVEIVPSVQLTSVSCRNGAVREIGLEPTRFDEASSTWVGAGGAWSEEVDELVLAVPAPALSDLVRTGPPGGRIVEAAPTIASVSRLRTQAVPILNLCFNRRLPHIPAEPVGLFQSQYGLAFTDLSQTWTKGTQLDGRTVLAVSASDPYGLPGTGWRDDGMAILVELARYVDGFRPGTAWGVSEDVDWHRTRYDANADAQLFVNETGSDIWRPTAACTGVSNLSFAGDLCDNRIGMTTIEAAVTTGLEAAQSVVERRAVGSPIDIASPGSPPTALFVWLRYAWAPYAYAAKAWSAGSDIVSDIARRVGAARAPVRHLLAPTASRARHRSES